MTSLASAESRRFYVLTQYANANKLIEKNMTYRFFRSTSAFLQTMFAYRLPTPLISVRAYIILRLPSTLVFSRRRMCYFSIELKRIQDARIGANIAYLKLDMGIRSNERHDGLARKQKAEKQKSARVDRARASCIQRN